MWTQDSIAQGGYEVLRSGTINENNDTKLKSPYVVLVSIDGFAQKYLSQFKSKNLNEMCSTGTCAKGLIPPFPSKTFPSHFSIVTGKSPEEHGLIDNFFWAPDLNKEYSLSDPFTVVNPEFYKSTPLWVTVQKSGLMSAVFFWVGSEAPIDGILPNYYVKYNGQVPDEKRTQQVIDWLKLPDKVRPHLIGLYFSSVDVAGHTYGPSSPEIEIAIQSIDAQIGKLREAIKSSKLPVTLILVSDHGMISVDPKKTIPLYELTQEFKVRISGSSGAGFIHLEDKSDIEKCLVRLKTYKHIKAYKRSNAPVKLKVRNNVRFGDIVVVAEAPYYILSMPPKKSDNPLNGQKGSHGWDPASSDMWGIYIEEGPKTEKAHVRTVLGAFSNTDVASRVLKILKVDRLQ